MAVVLTACSTVPHPSWHAIAPKVLPASVDLVRPNFDGTDYIGFCAGTVIAPGRVLTAFHCVAGESDLYVRLGAAGAPVAATVIKQDPALDLALLEVLVTWGWQVASLGDMPQVGDPIWIVGQPAGAVSQAVSQGIVSALGLTTATFWRDVPLLVSDAMTIGGNSGGGGFNAQGELVGVLVGGWVEGFSFLVSVDTVKTFLG